MAQPIDPGRPIGAGTVDAPAAPVDPADEGVTDSEANGDGDTGSRPAGTRLSRRMAKVRTGLPRTVLAALCGVLLALSFPPYGLWPLSLVAVAGLSLLTYRRTARQAAWTGFVVGAPFLLWLLYWLNVIGLDAWVLLSLFEALFLAAMAAGIALTSRLPAWPLWTACLWVAQEWARDRVPLGGFPWGRLAFANTSSPYTPLAALGGAPLVSFAVALTGASAAAAVLVAVRRGRGDGSGRAGTGHFGQWKVRAIGLVVIGAAAGLVGYAVPLPTAGTTKGGPANAEIAIIQGNVPHAGMDFLGRPMEVLDNHVQATLKLAAEVKAGTRPRPQLVVWPENASDVDPYTSSEAYAAIQKAVDAVGAPILVGAVVDDTADPQHVLNQGIVWDPSTSATPGPGASYTKQHLVPFGEYVPFRSVLSKYISELKEIPVDFAPGSRTGILQVGPARIGDVICFEVAYDGIVRDAVNKGGRVIVVQTNNATYERTNQPEQQFAMSRLRAVENGRAVVISSTSGISAVIEPDGSVQQRTQLATAAELESNVPLRDTITLADRVGAIPEWTLSIAGLLAVAAAVGLGSARKRRGTLAGATTRPGVTTSDEQQTNS